MKKNTEESTYIYNDDRHITVSSEYKSQEAEMLHVVHLWLIFAKSRGFVKV